MGSPSESQVRTHKAYLECGRNVSKTAKKLEINRTAVQKILFNAHLNGLTVPTEYCSHLPVGTELKRTSVYVNKDGEVSGTWYIGKESQPNHQELIDFYRERTPVCNVKFPKVKASNENLMLEWPIFDVHHGMLAWGEETGNDYDHKIARHLQVSAGKILLSSFGKVKRATIILGGDNQTADNREGKTEKSGNILDTDSRFAKMAWSCFESAVSSIEVAAQFAEEVYVIVLSGNHDYHSAIHHTIALDAYYRNVDKVTIDTSPARHRFYSWGRRVVMATHGDINEKRVAPYALKKAIEKGTGWTLK